MVLASGSPSQDHLVCVSQYRPQAVRRQVPAYRGRYSGTPQQIAEQLAMDEPTYGWIGQLNVLADHLAGGGALRRLGRPTKQTRNAEQALAVLRVDGRPPANAYDVRAAAAACNAELRLRQSEERWNLPANGNSPAVRATRIDAVIAILDRALGLSTTFEKAPPRPPHGTRSVRRPTCPPTPRTSHRGHHDSPVVRQPTTHMFKPHPVGSFPSHHTAAKISPLCD